MLEEAKKVLVKHKDKGGNWETIIGEDEIRSLMGKGTYDKTIMTVALNQPQFQLMYSPGTAPEAIDVVTGLSLPASNVFYGTGDWKWRESLAAYVYLYHIELPLLFVKELLSQVDVDKLDYSNDIRQDVELRQFIDNIIESGDDASAALITLVENRKKERNNLIVNDGNN